MSYQITLSNPDITEHISERTIALPFYNNLSETEVDFVVENLKEIVGFERRVIWSIG